jgi:hypothetical protein
MFRSLWRRCAAVSPSAVAEMGSSFTTGLRPLPRFVYLLEKEKRSTEDVAKRFQESFFPKFAAQAASGKNALELYCGGKEDVLGLTLLLMKVFDSEHDLDRLRFIFALGLRELSNPPASFFATYLAALTRHDAFTEEEIKHAEQLMKDRGVTPDGVIRLCLIELKLRMGKNVPREAILEALSVVHKSLVEDGEVANSSRDPTASTSANVNVLPASKLLMSKLRDVSSLILRAYHDSEVVLMALRERFLVEPPTLQLLLGALLRFSRDESSTPAQVCEILLLIEKASFARQVSTIPKPLLTDGSASGTSASTPATSTEAGKKEESVVALLGNEEQRTAASELIRETILPRTALRLLAKCNRKRDLTSAVRIIDFLRTHGLLQPEQQDLLGLTLLTVASAEGNLQVALDTIEDVLPERCCDVYYVDHHVLPDEATRFGRLLFDVHPISTLMTALLKKRVATVDEGFYYLESRLKQGKPVTTKSLNLIVAACAELMDEGRAIETLEEYSRFGVKPTAASYAQVLRVCKGSAMEELGAKHRQVLAAMQAASVMPDRWVIKAMLSQALEANDIGCAMDTIRVAAQGKLFLEDGIIRVLLSRLASLRDVQSIATVLQAVQLGGAKLHRSGVATIVRSLRLAGVHKLEILEDYLKSDTLFFAE